MQLFSAFCQQEFIANCSINWDGKIASRICFDLMFNFLILPMEFYLGKTLCARAVANRTDACFIRVIGSELVQKYVGEGARMVRELFEMARTKKACLIFFDEIDAIGGARFDDGAGGDNEVQRYTFLFFQNFCWSYALRHFRSPNHFNRICCHSATSKPDAKTSTYSYRTMLELINQLDGFDPRGNIKVSTVELWVICSNSRLLNEKCLTHSICLHISMEFVTIVT